MAIIAFNDSDRHEDLNASWHQRDALRSASHLAGLSIWNPWSTSLSDWFNEFHDVSWCFMMFHDVSWCFMHLPRLRISWYRPDLHCMSSEVDKIKCRRSRGFWWDVTCVVKSLCFCPVLLWLANVLAWAVCCLQKHQTLPVPLGLSSLPLPFSPRLRPWSHLEAPAVYQTSGALQKNGRPSLMSKKCLSEMHFWGAKTLNMVLLWHNASLLLRIKIRSGHLIQNSCSVMLLNPSGGYRSVPKIATKSNTQPDFPSLSLVIPRDCGMQLHRGSSWVPGWPGRCAKVWVSIGVDGYSTKIIVLSAKMMINLINMDKPGLGVPNFHTTVSTVS